jgi:hypothetical protein
MTIEMPLISKVMDSILVLKPKPSPYRLKRIGGRCDGGYLVPDDLDGIEACFSPGVNNFKHFEDILTDSYDIKCHMCDYSSDASKLATPLRQGMQTFKKKWLDIDNSVDSIFLEAWVNELSSAPDSDLLLQMDIEGAEYRNLLNCKDDVLQRFRIIILELHGLCALNNLIEFEKGLAPLLRKIDQYFICIHTHPNNYGGDFMIAGTDFNMPNLLELTFLRRDRFERVDASNFYQPQIPHPQDISLNDRAKPPLFLNEAWCSNGSRSLASKFAMARAQLNYSTISVLRKIRDKARSILPFGSR